MIEELKQRMIAKSAKIRRFEQQRIKQFKQNMLFEVYQKRIYIEPKGGRETSVVVPNVEESKQFWGNIWSVKKEHNQGAEWLKDQKADLENEHHCQERVIIIAEKVSNQRKEMSNWKALGLDGVQGY